MNILEAREAKTSTKERSLQLSKALLEQELTKPLATIASVAEKLGCTSSAITQALDANPELKEKLLAAKVRQNTDGALLDGLYDKMELKALQQLERTLPYVTDPLKLARMAEMMNKAKRRGVATEAPEESLVVRLLLPKMMEKKLQFGSNNEVVQVGDRALVTMPTVALLKLAEERQAAKENPQLLADVTRDLL